MGDFFRIRMHERLGSEGQAAAGRVQSSPIDEVWSGDGDLMHPNDLHHGTESDDTLNGLGGNDTLYGEGGNDKISGQVNNDVMVGGDGDDAIYDTDGNDFADGGDGNDDMTLGNINGSSKVVMYGRDGNDIMTLRGLTKAYGGQGDDYVSLGHAAVISNQLTGDGGMDTLFMGEGVQFLGDFDARQAGFEIVSADHAISGDAGKNKLYFYATGTLAAFLNGLTIFGDAGDDRLIGTPRGDVLHGGADADTLQGQEGNDTLTGDDGDDLLSGEDGNDELHADDIDTALGDKGDDVIYLTDASSADGGSGADTVDLVNFRLGSVQDFQGGAGQDTLVIETSVLFDIKKLDLTDASFEILAPNAIIQGGGDDNKLLFGHAHLADGYTGVTMSGGEGDDVLQGLNDSNDRINGDHGDDKLYGLSGNDTLNGGGGLDMLDGGDGNDVLNSEGGNVQLLGGEGDDVLDVTGVQAPELAPAEAFGGRGDDTIRIHDSVMAPPRDGPNGAVLIQLSGGQGQDTLIIGANMFIEADLFAPKLLGFEVLTPGASLNGGNGANVIDLHGLTVVGGLGGGYVSGNGGDDVLIGTGADDRLIGGSGGDDLRGGAGEDSLFGGDNNDTVDGGGGDDSLVGEAGVDLVTYASATGAVTVSLAIAGAQATGGAGTDILATFEDLTGSRFGDSLAGNTGDNRITGGLGGDTVASGGGADTFVLRSAADSTKKAADLITDLGNNDQIDVHGVTSAFHLVGGFSHAAGEATLTYDSGADRTALAIDVDGDAKADCLLLMAGDHTGFTGFVT